MREAVIQLIKIHSEYDAFLKKYSSSLSKNDENTCDFSLQLMSKMSELVSMIMTKNKFTLEELNLEEKK